jgi:hypothetical protein
MERSAAAAGAPRAGRRYSTFEQAADTHLVLMSSRQLDDLLAGRQPFPSKAVPR